MENKGTLGKNKYYEEGSKKPTYKGKGSFNGVSFEIAGWVNENKETGEKFFSLSFQEPYKKTDVVAVEGDSESIPF